MKKAWLSVIGLFVAVLVAGVFAASCGGDDTTEEGTDCATACADKECGEVDGCTCGTCGEGEVCTDNMCQPEGVDCTALCEGLECGDKEGCPCGTCGEGLVCEENMCVEEGGPDCAEICGEKECGTVEECDCGTCEDGFECNMSGVCECVPVCQDADGNPFECGDNGCGESDGCGTCDYGTCEDHVCVCVPDCDGKDCGPDGCGDTCGDCGDDICQDGICVAAGDCSTVTFAGVVQKVVTMEVGAGGHPGEALDVDGDETTCAPEGDCEDGLNNQLSGLLGQIATFVDANAEIANALTEGSIILLAEMVDMATDGTEFTMNMYIGELDGEGCDFQTEKCNYFVKEDSLDPVTCEPIIMFENAAIVDGHLTAGGPDALFSISIPVQEGLILDVTANMAQIVGDITGEGDAMVLENGLIGGAVRKDKLMEAVDMIPEDVDLPVNKQTIKTILDSFVQPDVDTDDDGELDAASVGVKFTTLAGAITGLEPEEAAE